MEEQHGTAATAPGNPPGVSPRDLRHYRATYGVAYPTDEVKFKTKADFEAHHFDGGERRRLVEKKVYWELSGATISRVVFRGCNFHTEHGRRAAEVSSLTFEECAFNSCILGLVRFHRTTFRGCSFTRCDMSRTEFDDCTFESCTFQSCTLWDATLQRTLIDPSSLLDGFDVPAENLCELVEDERRKIEDRLLRSRVALADQVLRSNEERRNTLYCDRALFQNRRAALAWQCREQASKPFPKRIRGWPVIALSAAYLHLTLGGTSLKRLLVVAIFICLGFAGLLASEVIDIAVRGTSAASLSFSECLSAAASLFFAFGYTNLSARGGMANAVITTLPLGGMVWSAVVLAVIVRRVYR